MHLSCTVQLEHISICLLEFMMVLMKPWLLWQPAQESVCNNTIIIAHDATSEGTDFTDPCHDQSTNQTLGPVSRVQSNDLEYSQNAVVSYNSSDLRSLSIVSDSLRRFQLSGDDHAHVTTTSRTGLVVSDSDNYLRSGDLLRLDLVSISSNTLSDTIAEANSDESRRNSLRLFWDALSRRSLRRHSDAPTFVLATGLADDLGAHDRWLFDFSGDLHYYGGGRDHDSFSSRRHRGNERRWLLRSEVRYFVVYKPYLNFLFKIPWLYFTPPVPN